MNKADRAEELFRKGYNCSQSVFVAFAEELGMSEEEAARTEEPPFRGRLPHCGGNRRKVFAEREWLRYKK